MTADVGPAWSGEAYDAWYEEPWGRYAFAVETQAVLSALGSLAAGRVLDGGCGSGRLLPVLAARDTAAVGLDLEPAMLTVAARRTGVPLVRGDVQLLPFPAAVFDAAVAVVEFVSDPALAIEELCRVVRPGGRLVIGALNPRSPWGITHRWALRGLPWEAARFLRRDELCDLARPYGHVTVRGALFAPGAMPGLSWLGPLLEQLGGFMPSVDAFQVITIDRR